MTKKQYIWLASFLLLFFVTGIPVEKKSETVTEIPVTQSISKEYKVTRVVDGDTIKVDIDGTIETIRIIGVDTPETVDPRKPVQCFGKEASDKAKSILTDKSVTLETDITQGDRDKYDRLLRYVFLDGTDYGKSMIASGYAHEYTYKDPYKYQADYKIAQTTAQKESLGFWSSNTCNGVTVSSL